MDTGEVEAELDRLNLYGIEETAAGAASCSAFSMGEGTLRVPMELHARNRRRICKAFRGLFENDALILLKGGEAKFRDATDHEELFRQESFFHWTFGVKEPDCFGLLEPDSGKSVLFIPRLPQEYETWMGKIASPEQWEREYEVEEVKYVDEISSYIGANRRVYFMEGTNTDSGEVHRRPQIDGVATDVTEEGFLRLYELFCELRMVKTQEELEVLRYSAKISSAAHVAVMQQIRPGMHEYELESLFRHYCYSRGGCRHTSYTCICGSGPNGAILHYGHAGAPNDGLVKEGDICLFDMGAEYHCYGADITCSFPANGKFSAEQVEIYSAVLESQKAVLNAVKAGVSWIDMHLLAEKTILSKLKDAGYLRGDVTEMVEARVGAVFMPHGLGHSLGIDTHDVGGRLRGHSPKPAEPGLKSLRLTRTLRKNMVVTIEPGVYLNAALIRNAEGDPQLSRFLVMDKIEKLMEFGGVRLEDDVIITEDGCENMTAVPREIEDVERVVSGGLWPPK
mmetsp:Transcript_826/g.2668  ORF Transcript_826/g.2668 Transcript_826/m.2668 type:complete len:509 (-) Transcript_826:285-1811(-)